MWLKIVKFPELIQLIPQKMQEPRPKHDEKWVEASLSGFEAYKWIFQLEMLLWCEWQPRILAA